MPPGREGRKAEAGRGAACLPRSVSDVACLLPAVCHKQKKFNHLVYLVMAGWGDRGLADSLDHGHGRLRGSKMALWPGDEGNGGGDEAALGGGHQPQRLLLNLPSPPQAGRGEGGEGKAPCFQVAGAARPGGSVGAGAWLVC